MGWKWCHIVILTCISLMTNSVEHPFMCFLSIHTSSLKKFLVFAPKIAFLGRGNIQDSCLENSMDREAWQATVHGVIKSRTRLSD